MFWCCFPLREPRGCQLTNVLNIGKKQTRNTNSEAHELPSCLEGHGAGTRQALTAALMRLGRNSSSGLMSAANIPSQQAFNSPPFVSVPLGRRHLSGARHCSGDDQGHVCQPLECMWSNRDQGLTSMRGRVEDSDKQLLVLEGSSPSLEGQRGSEIV